MLAQARDQRADVVYGVRSDRSSDSAFKRLSATAFYRVIRMLSGTHAQVDAGDYRLMSRATVNAINALPEHHRVLRFVVPALGFPSTSVTYRRDERAAGRSKYPLSNDPALPRQRDRLLDAPLRAATWLGLLGGLAAFALLAYALVAAPRPHPPGWTSTVVAVAGVGAVQLCASASSASTSGGCTRNAGPTVLLRRLRLAHGPVTPADEPAPSVTPAAFTGR